MKIGERGLCHCVPTLRIDVAVAHDPKQVTQWKLTLRGCRLKLADGKDEEGRDVKMPDAKMLPPCAPTCSWCALDRARPEPKTDQEPYGHSSIQQIFDTYGYLFEARDDD
jgi:hypothetical protein